MDNSHNRHARVLDWDDGRSYGDPIIVTLIRGFAFHPDDDYQTAEHVRGFETIGKAMTEIRQARPCQCQRCTGQVQ
jgi:hypothetical protein